MTVQRYIIAPTLMVGETAKLVGADAHHAARVMRMQVGDECIVSDGISRVARMAVERLEPNEVQLTVQAWLPLTGEPAWQVTVAQGLPKGDKMDTIVQKGTEIGAVRFVPFVSERAIVQYDAKKQAKKRERWGVIAKEAAEQAHRVRVPEIAEVHTWRELLDGFAQYELVLFCYELDGHTGKNGLRTIVNAHRALLAAKQTAATAQAAQGDRPRLLLVIGPEGGFTGAEARAARAAGAEWVGLGARILRTETASLFALACLMYASGELDSGTAGSVSE
jgi:16S rRNA (uracil1498-N3)-methyltransferase